MDSQRVCLNVKFDDCAQEEANIEVLDALQVIPTLFGRRKIAEIQKNSNTGKARKIHFSRCLATKRCTDHI